MTLRNAAKAALLVLVALGVALATALSTVSSATASPVSASPSAGKVVYYNLTAAEVKPPRIFTAYSSSPYIDKLTWKKWGTNKTIGRGIYVSDCASCAGPDRRKAIITLAGLEKCDNGQRTYKFAKIRVSKPDEGDNRLTYRLPTGCELARD